MITQFFMQLVIVAVAAVVLALVYGLCILFNTKFEICASHEHRFIYPDELGTAIGKIHFFVSAVPIVMFTIFAAANVKVQFSRETIIWYGRIALTITLIAIFIGVVVQTICINKYGNRRFRP